MNDLFADNNVPRGVRNNNWLNIKDSKYNSWKGQVGTDGTFCVFVSPSFGIRAARKIANTYLKRNPNMTVEEFIKTWCPNPAEYNNYIPYVIRNNLFGRLPSYKLRDFQFRDWSLLFLNMAEFENGQKYMRLIIGKYDCLYAIHRGLAL